jgi:hypothetical protein
MKPKTRIIPTLKGHTIVLEIGVQSFEMREYLGDSDQSSFDQAKWYKKQLDHALSKITIKNP